MGRIIVMHDRIVSNDIGRREFIGSFAGAAVYAGIQSPFEYARDAISPGETGIRITGVYRTQITTPGWGGRVNNWGGIIVRIETNTGIVGYGECRDVDSQAGTWLSALAPHIIGMNPTKIEDVYDTMMQHYAPPPVSEMRDQEKRGTGAISGIEMACWDIVGKVYNTPIYQLLGPRYNERIRLYGDTYGNTVNDIESRIEKGFTIFKCFTYLTTDIAQGQWTTSATPNNYGYKEITFSQTGLDLMAEYMEQHRDVLKSYGEPYASAPIGSDHYQGYDASDQLSVESAIALSEAIKPHIGGGWVEDIIDWWIDRCSGAPLKAVNDATDVAVLTGEDMFGVEQFGQFADRGALNIIHPEPNTAGGFNQTVLSAKYAHTKGITTAFHNSSGPIAMTAYAHMAAAIPDFVGLEFNKIDYPWHDDLIDGVDKPLIQNGYMNVPEGPGLGITPNAAQFDAHGAGTWTKIA